MSWRLARSLTGLRAEVNQRWPRRSKTSDGTVGNAEHAARPSDHNPNSAGVVRALDITAEGIDAPGYAEHLRARGAAGHRPLRNGGVVIFNRRIASSARGWVWRKYTGSNPHTGHVHASVATDPAGYDDQTPWGLNHDQNEDAFMAALSEAEQRELLDRVRRLEGAIHGTDDPTRATSIWWRMKYVHDELLDGDNKVRLRRILAKFGV